MNKKIVFIMVGVIAISSVTYAFFASRVISPEEELMQAEKAFAELDSYAMAMTLEMETTGQKVTETVIDLKINHDKRSKAIEGNINIGVLMPETAMDFGGSFIYVDDDLYGKIGTFPFVMFPLTAEKVDLLTKNHILLVENLRDQIDQILLEFSQAKELDPITLEEILEESIKLSQKLWKDEIIIVNQVSADKADGRDLKRYDLAIESQKMADFVLQMFEKYHLLTGISEMTKEQQKEILTQMQKAIENAYQDIEITIWTDGKYPVRTKTFSETQLVEDKLETMKNTPEKIQTTVEVEYLNFNQDFAITAPKEYIVLDKIFSGFKEILKPIM